MPGLDWSQCPAVESIPGKVGGAWVFRDTRLPVATVIENLEGRKIAIVVLAGSTKWSLVRLHHERIATVVHAATPGSYTEVAIPFA